MLVKRLVVAVHRDGEGIRLRGTCGGLASGVEGYEIQGFGVQGFRAWGFHAV